MGDGITAGLVLAAMTLTTLARKNVVDGVATFRMQPGSYARVRERLHDGLLRTVRLGHGPSRGATPVPGRAVAPAPTRHSSSRSRAAKEVSGLVSSV
ncbi:hypothetical protein [Streptomyces sp. NPDC057580]|uniref:hypothetical protein n=1 Tax=Streptomyces sp. NPDC057580 TaxID=3346173 RepID=UPI00368CA188